MNTQPIEMVIMMVGRGEFVLQVPVEHLMRSSSVAHAMVQQNVEESASSMLPSAPALPHTPSKACARRCGGDVDETRQATRAYPGCFEQAIASLRKSHLVSREGTRWMGQLTRPHGLVPRQSATDWIMTPFDSSYDDYII